jgi:hypothetical protein
MTGFLSIGGWVLGSILFAAAVYFLVLPWIPPLYEKYKAWIKKLTAGS